MDLSFTGFLGELLENPALLVTTLFTLGVIFVNGWTDAPNAIAPCVTTRCLSARNAIIMSAFFNFLGVFIMTQINSSVASTISNMVDFGDSTQNALVALCAALLSIVIYSVGASIRHPARHRRHQRGRVGQGSLRPCAEPGAGLRHRLGGM